MPQPQRKASGIAGAPGEETTSRPCSQGSAGYASHPQNPSGSPDTPLGNIMEKSAHVLKDETITVDSCKALIQELVKVLITIEERLSRTEKKVDDILKHISKPETYTTGTAIAAVEAAAAAIPTTPGCPRERPPRWSPKSTMIEMMESEREEQQTALYQIQCCSEEGISW